MQGQVAELSTMYTCIHLFSHSLSLLFYFSLHGSECYMNVHFRVDHMQVHADKVPALVAAYQDMPYEKADYKRPTSVGVAGPVKF